MNYEILIKNLGFGTAFECIKDTTKYGMRLPEWDKDVVVRFQMPDENSKMTYPYLYIQSRFGCGPWKETVIEMFSEEWQVVEIYEKDKIQPIKRESNNNFRDTWYDCKSHTNKDNNPKVEKVNKINKIKNDKPLTDEVKVRKDRDKTINKKHNCSPECEKRCLHECCSTSDKLIADPAFVAYILGLF